MAIWYACPSGDEDNYHQFCRLLGRLKASFQLPELVNTPLWNSVIEGITHFTVFSLEHWHVAPNSCHYLLKLWERLVQSVSYSKSEENHRLQEFTPQVTQAFVQVSRSTAYAQVAIVTKNASFPTCSDGLWILTDLFFLHPACTATSRDLPR